MPDRIHTFDFLRLSRKPSRPGDEWTKVVRAGVNGVQLWGTGHRGSEHGLISISAHTNIAAACAAFRQYCVLRGMPPVEIEFAADLEPNCLYKILDVQPVDEEVRQQLRGVKAGSSTNFQGWLVCQWLVLPVNELVP